MKVTLEMDENQARIVLQALDCLSRLYSGQVDVVLHTVLVHSKRWKELCEVTGGHGSAIESIRHLALLIGELMTGLPSGTFWSIGNRRDMHENAQTAWDINEVLRHALAWFRNPKGGATVDFGEPMHWNPDQPLPKVKIE
ncbi:MAG: hypothetical protein WC444_04545 [Candidatus Paceibacterota bacterium]